ncbi:MAG: hypothetical protein ACTSWD_02495 [Candidatus Heimdallarchaeota archaeon]
MENQIIIDTWKKVFPNSAIYPSKACFSDYYFKCTLAKDKSENSHGYIENDALYYHFNIDDGKYTENGLSIHIKPDTQYLCYSSRSIRKKSIKNITQAKLQTRFEQVKQLVIDNKDNFKDLMFDINTKI